MQPSTRAFTGAVALALGLAGCASKPQLTPWRADALLTALPPSCTAGAAAPPPADAAAAILPSGVTVVRSAGKDVVLVAARACLMAIDAQTGAAEPLPTRGDSIAPTMVDGASDGIAFSSSLSGSVRIINTDGIVSFNVSGLRRPLGVRYMPGGSALVAEYDSGRIVNLGPTEETRAKLVADKLDGPVGLVVVDATKGYVTETRAGRVTEFRLDRFETKEIASGLKQPEGIALLGDGRLAVAEVGLRRLVAIDPKTGDIEVMADNLAIGLAADTAGGEPHTITDVAAAPDGTLYLSADVDRTVMRVTPRPATTK